MPENPSLSAPAKPRLKRLPGLGAAARLVAFGLVVNVFLAGVKLTAGLLGNSFALVADALESTGDIATSMVVLAALRVARRPADERHPYGHGKAEPLAAVVVAGALIFAAIEIARTAIHEITTPHKVAAPFTLAVLAGVIGVKEILARRLETANRVAGSAVIQGDAWHHRSDALSSVAAFVGILVGQIGGPHYASADDWAALVAAGVISVSAIRFSTPAIHELLDASPDPAVETDVRTAAADVPGVIGLHRCRVRKHGPVYYVELDVQVDPQITVGEGHRIAHTVQDAVLERRSDIQRVLIHIEPPKPPSPAPVS